MLTEADEHEGTDKPLRADAERNRRRILEAARDLFATRGLDVTLNDIAHHAGVGVGTVYRRFPDKKQLIDDLFEESLAAMVGFMNEALADPDPWHGMTGFLENALEMQASNRGLKDLITGMPDGLERVALVRSRLMPLGSELARRAHEAGQLREDIEPQDLPLIQLMLVTIMDAAREVDPDVWRRYLQIVLRGMSAQPETLGPLEPGPVRPQDVDKVMSALRPARR
jgi:AcrR family transcriptional regulator